MALRIVASRSDAPRSRELITRKTPPRPVICWTADTMPAAKSPWPARMARTSTGSLIVFLQVLSHLGRVAHLLDQSLVETLGRINAAVFQQVVHRDDLADHRDVLAGIQQHARLGE